MLDDVGALLELGSLGISLRQGVDMGGPVQLELDGFQVVRLLAFDLQLDRLLLAETVL